jgi:hypothetical protein
MRIARTVFGACLLCCASELASADDPPPDDFFFSMRASQNETVLRYVAAATESTDDQPVAEAGCDGKTYYVTPDDASVLAAALANQNTVQLQSAPAGGEAEQSAIVCLMQAGSQ